MTRADNRMSSASLILGIISCISAALMTVYLPFIFGGLSIVCAILSRDRSGIPDRNAKAGITVSVISIVINIVVISVSVYTVFNNPEQFAMFNSLFEKFYGMDFRTYMDTYMNEGLHI